MPAASTDPIRAWRSGNRWFLAQCAVCTGKLGYCRAGQCVQVENSGHTGCRRGQRDRMAGLTNAAGIAVRVCCVRFCTISVPWAVSRSWGRIDQHCLCVLMSLRPRFMGMRRYYFSSTWLLLHLGSKHSRRHCIAHPTAQRQQGDHQDEKQGAHHTKVRYRGLLAVDFILQGSIPLSAALRSV